MTSALTFMASVIFPISVMRFIRLSEVDTSRVASTEFYLMLQPGHLCRTGVKLTSPAF
jgi:hypothetical protein